MSAQSEVPAYAVGEYVVIRERTGEGIDYYFSVTGPDGSRSEQKVYWMHSMTPYQVAEKAVSGHLGHDEWMASVPTRLEDERGYVVTVD